MNNDNTNIAAEEITNAKMTESDRLHLQKMIKEQNTEDNTDSIRGLKHSVPIAEDILKIQSARARSGTAASAAEFRELCISQCPFLYNNYTDIFNRVVGGELDLAIFSKFLYVLKQIEDEKTNYHDASYTIGKLLKELYVDSAIRRGAVASAAADEANAPPPRVKPKNITWVAWKAGTVAR
jgi:hypothetical protein